MEELTTSTDCCYVPDLLHPLLYHSVSRNKHLSSNHHIYSIRYELIDMTTVTRRVPSWVAQLESPPAAKAKIPGIQDPNGYSTAPPSSGNKVRRPTSEMMQCM